VNLEKYKFGKELTVIRPCFWDEHSLGLRQWKVAMRDAESAYMDMMTTGSSPQEARSVLPHSIATEIVVTANLREWRHILKLRTSKAAHPQMRVLMVPLLADFQRRIPVVFDDISEAG
jgi:thymidylate synthase (FAD)